MALDGSETAVPSDNSMGSIMHHGFTKLGRAAVIATVAGLLAACGASAATSTANSPPAAVSTTPAAASPVAADPVPTCPNTGTPGGPCNWSQGNWAQYLADLGVTQGSDGECLAQQVARQVDFTTADEVAKAFPPGTSGKNEQDYINALVAGGMDPTDAQVAVVNVMAAQENADCSSSSAPQPAASPSAVTTQPAAAATPTQPAAESPAPSASPTGSAGSLPVWRVPDTQALTALYNADTALHNVQLACLVSIITPQDDPKHALEYARYDWVIPAPTVGQLRQILTSKFGAAEAATDISLWPAAGVAGCPRS